MEVEKNTWPMGQVDTAPKADSALIYAEPSAPQKKKNTSLAKVTASDAADYSRNRLTAVTHKTEVHIGGASPRVQRKQSKVTADRQARVEKNQRLINRHDMADLKAEVTTLLREEGEMNREQNARTRMTTMIMVQCCKLVDLYEEGEQYMDVIDKINERMDNRKIALKEKEDAKSVLEKENEVLRAEISKLRDTVSNHRAMTNKKEDKQSGIQGEFTKLRNTATEMVRCARGATDKMNILKNAMHDAEKSMESSIQDIGVDTDIV